jgi:hypothetical protein
MTSQPLTTVQPRILDFSGVVIITTPFPAGPLLTLLPRKSAQRHLKVDMNVRATWGDKYFMVTIDTLEVMTQEDWDRKTRFVLQFVWYAMVQRGLVTGSMPVIEKINPCDIPYVP